MIMRNLFCSVLLALGLPALSLPFAVLANVTETKAAANKSNTDFVAGKRAIKSKEWKAAIEAFGKAAQSEPDNADIQNYLGYAYRNAGDMDNAFLHYERALRLDPKHRGAHEYVGQAYLLVGKPGKADEHLATLEKICGKGCEEYQDLAGAIAAYNKSK